MTLKSMAPAVVGLPSEKVRGPGLPRLHFQRLCCSLSSLLWFYSFYLACTFLSFCLYLSFETNKDAHKDVISVTSLKYEDLHVQLLLRRFYSPVHMTNCRFYYRFLLELLEVSAVSRCH